MSVNIIAANLRLLSDNGISRFHVAEDKNHLGCVAVFGAHFNDGGLLLLEISNSYDIVSTAGLLGIVELSVDPKSAHNKLLSMGSGLFLLVFSIMVVVLDSSNFLAFGLAFFVLMIGIMLVMVGAVGGLDNNKKEGGSNQSPTTTQIVHEIVKVRCKYCNSLNFETSQRCANCGAQL